MHDYRCQKVYIPSTASERIVDTFSSMDQLLRDAYDTTDSLKHTHSDVPFATIGDDTITALA
jgi:hypothetical protein